MSVPPASPMHPLSSLISVEEAFASIDAEVRPTGRTEAVELASAVGRVCAQEISAKEDTPSFDMSRMDGYAVASADLAEVPEGTIKLLKIVGRVAAGGSPPALQAPGTCVEIATGARIPRDADAVVPAEHARPIAGGEVVEFSRLAAKGQNILPRGSDYRAGDVLLSPGDLITPAKVAAAASANEGQLVVRARPRVLIVPTGDEVAPLGAPLLEGQVRETNSHALSALIASRGGSPDRHPVVRDAMDHVLKALERTRDYDAVVFTGGSSAGVKDLLEEALARVGSVTFHGVRLRPGKPVLFGNAHGRPVLGLPGNPTSCVVAAHLFLDRLVARLAGGSPTPMMYVSARLTQELRSPPDFLDLVLVELKGGEARPLGKDSLSVTGASRADGFVPVPPGKGGFKAGEDVRVVLLR